MTIQEQTVEPVLAAKSPSFVTARNRSSGLSGRCAGTPEGAVTAASAFPPARERRRGFRAGRGAAGHRADLGWWPRIDPGARTSRLSGGPAVRERAQE